MHQNELDTEILHVRVSRSLKEQMDRLTKETGQDQSTLAQEAIQEYVAFEAEQLAKIHRGIREADAGQFATPEQVEAVRHKYRAFRAERAG